MKTEDIIRMAREAGWTSYDSQDERFERFVFLVRDQMLSEGWRQCAQGQKTSQFCAVAEQARLEEREACARVCDDLKWHWPPLNFAENCAATIRARGTTPAA